MRETVPVSLKLVFQHFHPGGMVRYCGRLREVIFFLSMVPRGTGDVRGVFGGPLTIYLLLEKLGVVLATADKNRIQYTVYQQRITYNV